MSLRRDFGYCPKCGDDGPAITYYERGHANHHEYISDKPEIGRHKEHFHIECTRCRYNWLGDVLPLSDTQDVLRIMGTPQ